MMLEQLYAVADALTAGAKAGRTRIISGRENLAGLRRYLGRTEPELVSAALKFWKTQGGLLSQAEIEWMMSTLTVPASAVASWERTNEKFVREGVAPELEVAASASAADIEARVRRILKAGDTTEAIKRWVRRSAGALIARLNADIRQSINAILRIGIAATPMSPYQLSRLIRPLIGLTERWSRAVFNRYGALIGTGLDASRALAESEKYATFLHKARAMNIARTELSNAYNEGQMAALKATGEVIKKRWATADDERLCEDCENMDGEERNLDEDFSGGVSRPPLHPGCRCSLEYELVR